MQDITIDYENEKGEVIEILPVNFADVLNILYKDYETSKKKYPWTISIDPYGDTTFNLLQWPYLISEFTELEKILEDEKAKNIVVGLIQFLEKNKNNTHTCLKFIGD